MPSALSAQYQRPGSSDGQFLKIGVSARAAGLGEAYISVTDGAEATYYNPAALARIPRADLVFTHTRWFAGINHDFAAVALSFGSVGTFALSGTAIYTDEMMVRTPLQPDGTGETFYAGNYQFGISYSRFLTDRVTLGGTIRYVYMSLYQDFNASAVAGDIAILYTAEFRGFRFGMKIANFGSEVTYVHESYPLPTNFQFGMSMNAIQREDQTAMVCVSAIKPNDGQPLGQIGVEWNWRRTFYLRGGYHLNYDIATYAFGAGLRLIISGYELQMDYSFSNYSLLGGAHRLGLRFSLF